MASSSLHYLNRPGGPRTSPQLIVLRQHWGGVQPKKKNSPIFEICGSVRFFWVATPPPPPPPPPLPSTIPFGYHSYVATTYFGCHSQVANYTVLYPLVTMVTMVTWLRLYGYVATTVPYYLGYHGYVATTVPWLPWIHS